MAKSSLSSELQKSIGRSTQIDSAQHAPRARTDSERLDLSNVLGPPQGEGELGRLAQYRVLKILGQGGMGMVLLAEDSQLLRLAALKIMLPKHAADPLARERFLREARTAARIKHDHVITIFQVGEERDIPFIAMEYLKGTSLEDYLTTQGQLAIGQAVRVARQTAEGLQAAHAEGLIHRDIKPANIWLEAPKGRVKILDFGLARPQQDDLKLTQTGALIGTPLYMSPEQALGEKLDQRSDLFSLGIVLYQLLSGELPFKGNTMMAVIAALTFEPHISLRQLKPEIPIELERLVDRLLAKKREDRPQSAEIVAEELAAMPLGESGIQHAITVETPTARTVKQDTAILLSDTVGESRPRPLPLAEAITEPHPKPRTKWVLIVGIALGFLGFGGYLAVREFNRPPPPPNITFVYPNETKPKPVKKDEKKAELLPMPRVKK